MKHLSRISSFVIIIVAAAVAAYATAPPLEDLRVTSLTVEPWGAVPRTDEPIAVPEPNELLIVVRFHTNANLETFGDNALHNGLFVKATLCSTGERISEGFNLVYDELGKVGLGERPKSIPPSSNYHFYIELQSKDIPGFNKFNLLAKPQDVCVTLVRPSIYVEYEEPAKFIKIRKEELESALEKAAK